MHKKSRSHWASLVLLLLAFQGTAEPLYAWGELGHFVVGYLATKLLKDPNLHTLMTRKDLMAGHVSNFPDIMWRRDPAHDTIADHTHSINPLEGEGVDAVPTDWKAWVKKVGKSEVDVAKEQGSLWWRAEQFYNRAKEETAKAKSAYAANHIPEYTQAVVELMGDLAILAHYTGDASMPFHNSADYDGWKVGHGGIHEYYEAAIVGAIGLAPLIEKVMARANEIQAQEAAPTGTVLERMKALSVYSSHQIPEILAKDKITAVSDSAQRKRAERPAAETVVNAFESTIVDQLARSALLTRDLWEMAVKEGGNPSFKEFHSYIYPDPAYVPANYVKGAPDPASPALCDKSLRAVATH